MAENFKCWSPQEEGLQIPMTFFITPRTSSLQCKSSPYKSFFKIWIYHYSKIYWATHTRLPKGDMTPHIIIASNILIICLYCLCNAGCFWSSKVWWIKTLFENYHNLVGRYIHCHKLPWVRKGLVQILREV